MGWVDYPDEISSLSQLAQNEAFQCIFEMQVRKGQGVPASRDPRGRRAMHSTPIDRSPVVGSPDL